MVGLRSHTVLLIGAALVMVTSAHAADLPKKLAELEAKQDAQLQTSDRQKRSSERKMRRRVGRVPTPVLNIRNTWTDETLAVAPRTRLEIDAQTWNKFLRCHFTNEPTLIDDRLLGVLRGAARRFDRDRIYIVSGYRAPKYNLMLRKKGRQVAKLSQHTLGRAVDFRLPGVPVMRLYRYVRSLRLGGAGFYRHSRFVHADTGPVRTWSGR